ncbi:MAG: Lipopolysaccharide assembly protein B [Phycisphaerae bacterium]|nr:Lipopolysaccharide assembly protein B [Phycisphaerae bacterium]
MNSTYIIFPLRSFVRAKARRSLLLLGVVMMLGNRAVTDAQESKDHLHQSAQSAIAAKDYNTAIQMLTLLSDSEPQNTQWLSELAEAQRLQGDTAAALATMQRATKLQPADDPLAIQQAELHAALQDWSGMVQLLKLRADQTSRSRFCELLAQAYEQLGQQTDAAWYYERALQLPEPAVSVYLALSQLQIKRGTAASAIETLEKGTVLHPQEAELHWWLARAYYEAGRGVGKIIVVPLTDAIPEQTQGLWYVIEPQLNEPNRYQVCGSNCAIYHLQRAFELGWHQPEAYLLQADIWYQAEDYRRARELYELLAEVVPGPLQAGYHYRYGMSLLQLEAIDEAGTQFDRAVQKDPGSYRPKMVEVYQRLAEYYCLRGAMDPYIDYLERAVDLEPRRVELHYKLGNALHEAGRRAEAAVQYRLTLQMQPDHPDAERMLNLIEYLPDPTSMPAN